MPKIKNISKEELQEYKKAREKNYNRYYYLTKTKAKRKALRETRAKEVREVEKVCKFCGKTFTTTNSHTKYCSEECRHAYSLQYQKEYRKKPEFKAKMQEYYKSDEYKAVRKKYTQSEKGKATLKKYIKKKAEILKKAKTEKINTIKSILENYSNIIKETDMKAILNNLEL